MTREDALALAAQHDIDLFRVIRRAGRKDRDKAKAVSLYLAETIIAEAAAMRERAFQIGDRVEKISGSSWRGKVVGTYSTALTPEGYAVESETETGSVQIYPAKALRFVRALPATGEE